ncbi:polysaccharide deacetylase family protein [Ilyonectria robusta]|uniref:polysaccharide deacetylase family protein n=1 Tax=Ilyonectria robusta TaxID=1079257 RepID=UPI001E8CA20D|nr:polysaccharide deacetylase family protein [Ilyonectria robusta]KAH8675050.1 polysaccharide deacetylase family protein [Ilyonectria robusta]
MFTRYLLSALIAGAAASPVVDSHQRRQAIPVGSTIFSCTTENTIALTFDDGPFAYTNQLLDTLAEAGIKATFFINGDNWASIYSYTSTVHRMIADGHQIGSHTWDHPDLTNLGSSEVESQMTRLESALLDILGYFPTYMRPPFFSYNDQVVQTVGSLGYHVIIADIDTLDWENDSPDAISESIRLFNADLDAGGSIALAHDVHEQTVVSLAPAMIASVRERGLRAVTVGECLDDPQDNWYRTSR